jgi:Plasmid recombination enzyme
MAFAGCRVTKLSGAGSCAGADAHLERKRETENAQKKEQAERQKLAQQKQVEQTATREEYIENRRLIGDDGRLYDKVQQVIAAHGGKPRKDSVECVEWVFYASPEYFANGHGGHDLQKVEAFEQSTLKMVQRLEQRGMVFVKAMTHMDEQTPHVTAFAVPLDPNGKLNCKYHLGGRAKLSKLQTEFAECCQPLGLERGIKGSKATYQETKRWRTQTRQDFGEPITIAEFAQRREWQQAKLKDGNTLYYYDPNKIFEDGGLRVRPEAREPITPLYRVTPENNFQRATAFDNQTNRVTFEQTKNTPTPFMLAHDYYTQTGRSDPRDPMSTVTNLAEEFGAARAKATYQQHVEAIMDAAIAQAQSYTAPTPGFAPAQNAAPSISD